VTLNFSAAHLPAGVTASFTPNTLTLDAPTGGTVLVKLTAALTAPATNGVTTVSVGGATIGLSVSQAYLLEVGASGDPQQSTKSAVSFAALGGASMPVILQVASGVKGNITLATTTSLPAGISAQFVPASVAAPPDGGLVYSRLVLTAGASIGAGTTSVSFAAQVGSANRSLYTFPLTLLPPFVSGISPSTGTVPMFGQPGTLVTISGGGFASGTTVAFGNDTPVSPTSIGPGASSLAVNVPATAASGPVKVTLPSGVVLSEQPIFAVDNYRNTRGFMSVNNDVQNLVGGTYILADATAAFGSGQTICNVLGGNFTNPLVQPFLAIVNPALNSGGVCFGMSLSSLRFMAEQENNGYGYYPLQPAGQLEPNGPPNPLVWQLAGPKSNNSMLLPNYIHAQHLVQFSVDNILNYLKIHGSSWTAADLLTTLQSELKNGWGAIIAVNPSIGTGHVMVAYQVNPNANGDFDILVYNCNWPFTVSEDTNPGSLSEVTTAGTRSTAAYNSVISVTSSGTWTLNDLGGWTGQMWGITVTPWGTIQNPPLAPFTLSGLAALVAAGVQFAENLLLSMVTGAASVTQVGDGQGHVLLANGQWNMDPATMLAGVGPMPNFGGLNKITPTAFVGNTAVPLTHTVTGSATGTYDFQWVGVGLALALNRVPAAAGTNDTVVADAAAQMVKFTPASPKGMSATIIGTGTTSKLPRTATLKTTASAGAAVSLSFDSAAESFIYAHSGEEAIYTVELSSFDAQGQPTSFTTLPVSVAAGETRTFTPNWTQLATGMGTLQVRTAAGTVTSGQLKPA
jgi:hypothetical protein